MRRWGLIAAAALLAGCGSGATKTVTVTSAGATTQSRTAVTTATPTTTGTTPTTTGTTPTATPSGPTTTTPTAPASTVHLATFRTPSANIGCMIIGGAARCDIRQRSWSPPPTPKSCPPVVNYGQGLAVGASGRGGLVCAGDTVFDPGAGVLAYNADTVVGGFRCASRVTGMTCTNTSTGHGFFLAAQGYRAF